MRNYKLFIEDILDAINKIEIYTKGLSYEMFMGQRMVIDAVIRNIEIVGEAAKNIPENVKREYSHIPWNRMIGLRNITVHEYFGVDLDIIWEIVSKNLPETKQGIQAILEKLGEVESENGQNL